MVDRVDKTIYWNMPVWMSGFSDMDWLKQTEEVSPGKHNFLLGINALVNNYDIAQCCSSFLISRSIIYLAFEQI